MAMRLLCLHGKYQNSTAFARKTNHIAQELEGVAEFVFVDGPVKSVPKVLRNKPSELYNFRSWWNGNEKDRHNLLDWIEPHLNKKPIDGILGFSQGAAVASLLCSKDSIQTLGWAPKFAIMINGYLETQNKSEISSDIQSLHLFSPNDRVVSVERSRLLAQAFIQAQKKQTQTSIYEHTQGHIVPTDQTVVNAVTAFALQHQSCDRNPTVSSQRTLL